ncbi:ferredoxin reductase family protein [Actinoplanes couchii]|uniref:Oxidoreductase n=1 Tax=Actinoplanes couchii TaxID=403638 RepID=A0ABQ3X0C2_9ACTN|nr:ferric reductase-like transmembrane domain-containing protein [Actinoplanes couchii]MDR6316362.1 putative ferric reductase [Actinoplanes couchii]GID51976.1 oxidoreductase [Actinoplanes couchii]
MIAVAQPFVAVRNRLRMFAHLAVGAYLLGNLAIIHLLFLSVTPAHNVFGQVGRLLGLYLAFMMTVQVLLVARLPLLDRAFGMDRLTGWHRWTGFTVFWLAVLHPSFVVLGFARYDRVPVLTTAAALSRQVPVLLGMIAVGLIVVIAGLSVRIARRRLSYETWHAVHLLLYVVLILGIIHQVYEGTAFTINLVTRIYWWGLWTAALGALLTGRLIVPLIRNRRHRLRVAAVVPESDDVVSVHVTGRDLDRLQARAGQFFLWRFPGHHRWWQVNPFSLSAAPNDRSLRLTAKAVGTTSAGLRDLPIGARVFAEGPYGAFTLATRTCRPTLLIAGGIGVTPIRSLLEDPALGSDTIVIYRVRRGADAVLLGEIRNLTTRRGARLHVITGRTGPGNQPFHPPNLLRMVPDITTRDVYVCGPHALTSAVLAALRKLKVPSRQVHAELFRLAG